MEIRKRGERGEMIGWRQGEDEACEMREGESESESASKEEKDGIHIVSIIFFFITQRIVILVFIHSHEIQKKTLHGD